MKISSNWHDVLSQQLLECDTENRTYQLVQLEQKDFDAFSRIFHETCKPTKKRMEEFRKKVDEVKEMYDKREFNSPQQALECLFKYMMHGRRSNAKDEISQMRKDLFADAYKIETICRKINATNCELKRCQKSIAEYSQMLEGIEKEDLNVFLEHPNVKGINLSWYGCIT